jgi:hypothetical protein
MTNQTQSGIQWASLTVPSVANRRNFGRKTQKWPQKNISGRENPRPNFMHISQTMAEKGQHFLNCVFHLKS